MTAIFTGSSLRHLIGDRVRSLRTQHGLTRTALSLLLGVDYGVIHRLEVGRTGPNAWTLRRLCCVLGVSADWLLGLEETP